MRRLKKITVCHPDQPHWAKDLCKKCYCKAYKQTSKGKAVRLAYSTYYSEYYQKNKDKYSKKMRFYRKNNKMLINAHSAKYRTLKLNRIPKWADLNAIKQFYLNCPKGYVVDHIIPLRAKEASGLHVLENLQYLTTSENAKKHNKLQYKENTV